MPISDDVISGLQKCVSDKQYPMFQTYLDFHKQFGFGGLPNTWANRNVLNIVADTLKRDGMLDLTFLIYRRSSGYPSVIDGVDSREPTDNQKARARSVAQQIIERYRPGIANPY
jgi:hypothetical protein